MTEDPTSFPDRLADIYAGKSFFITGGTGFLGKVLVEKILRSCDDVQKLYLLVRTKKGKSPNERLREIFASPLYDTLKKQKGPDIFKKCVPIAGDVSCLNLGISEEDRKVLQEEVEVICHCAATIRFDEQLRKAVLLNVRGTKLMLDLAKECPKLKVFCHVSTAYCHLHERLLQEKAYPPPADPHQIIRCAEWMNDEVIDSITDKLLGDIPNTYAFTKALGEGLVVEQMDNLPVIIMRPSIVIPIWKEPIPGWTDNINGPTGLLIGAGKGVIRTMYIKGGTYADYLPVDIAVNGMLIMMWDYLKNKEKRIYHMCSSSEYKVSWEEIIDLGRGIINKKMPLNGVMWYPGGSMKTSRVSHNLAMIFYHLLPALVIDGLLILTGHKPVLMRVQKRINKGFEVFEYYANNQWDFCSDNVIRLRDVLNPREKLIYKIDGDGLDLEEYFTDCIHAARLYLLKEPDDTLPAARRHMKIMWFVDKLCKTLILFALGYFLLKQFIFPVIGL